MTADAPVAFSGNYLSLAVKSSAGHLISIFATGDAMAPTIRDLDLLLIDVTSKESSEGIVAIKAVPDLVVRHLEHRYSTATPTGIAMEAPYLVVRRLQRRPGGGYRLLCDNLVYPPFDVENVEIVGRVIWRGGKLP